MNKYPIKFLLLLLAVLAAAPGMAQDAAGFRPFVLASVSETGLEQQAATTTAAWIAVASAIFSASCALPGYCS